jgi:4-hydroxy-tetrahydrodipicolinate synthase
VAAAATVVAESPAGFEVFSGDDSLTLPFLSVGGVGVISVASHWAGGLFAEMVDSYRSGDVARATIVNQQLAESYCFESTEEYPNPVPAKAACRSLGLPAGQCRLPNAPAPEALDDQARAVIAKLGRLNPAHQSVA